MVNFARSTIFFFHKETVVTVAEYSLVIKPRAEILPIVFYCWISLFILSMWSVRHNIFVHQECKCTCWRYSKKKSNKQNKVKPTMMFTEITVSGYLLQRSLTGLPKFRKKKKKERKPQKLALTHQMEHKKLVSRIPIFIISQYSKIWLTTTMIWLFLYKTNFESYSLLIYLLHCLFFSACNRLEMYKYVQTSYGGTLSLKTLFFTK